MNTYWEELGKYQEIYDKLHKELVPESGMALTTSGEILRVASNVYYDLYNNGGCNLGSSKGTDLAQFLTYLSAFKFSGLRALNDFFSHFVETEVEDGWGNTQREYGDGYENFDELFTDKVSSTLEEAIDLLVVKANEFSIKEAK